MPLLPSGIDSSSMTPVSFTSTEIHWGAFTNSLFKFSTTAHLMGEFPFGRNDQEGVIDLDFQVFNYPGLYALDGSVMLTNPGVNPSLAITALAEYAMRKFPDQSSKIKSNRMRSSHPIALIPNSRNSS